MKREAKLMAKDQLNERVTKLFEECQWGKARALLEKAREKDHENHWLLTQLGVTYYEQRKYKKALQIFLKSQKIVPDCPLTLWNVAGTLSALGNQTEAMRIYTSLLQSNKSPEEDSCWESEQWTNSLKADCVYRLGDCFERQGKKRKAEHCYREYLDLMLIGIEGSYSIEDVKRQVQELHPNGKNGGGASELRKVANAALRVAGVPIVKRTRHSSDLPTSSLSLRPEESRHGRKKIS
jgi:hypothetical protein